MVATCAATRATLASAAAAASTLNPLKRDLGSLADEDLSSPTDGPIGKAGLGEKASIVDIYRSAQ